jgi:hypothetical protein
MKEVKRMTRIGMGNCQGRMCGPAMQEIISREKRFSPDSVGYLNPRPPVRPIPLGVLAGHRELDATI